FLAVGLLLSVAARGDPGRRLRAALLWTANPLLLFELVGGAHNDVLAIAFAVAGVGGVVGHRAEGAGRPPPPPRPVGGGARRRRGSAAASASRSAWRWWGVAGRGSCCATGGGRGPLVRAAAHHPPASRRCPVRR